MFAETQMTARRAGRSSFAILTIGAAALLGAMAPAAASAAEIVFEAAVAGQTAGWKPVDSVTPTSTGGRGYWDRRSYDSLSNTPVSACTAGMLVAGGTCDWAGGTPPPQPLTVDDPAGAGLEYFGRTNVAAGESDAPMDFFFTGPLDFAADVLFQLTAWDDTVEFGWYDAGSPDSRHVIFAAGGPHTATPAQPTNVPVGAFGFYYRNTRYGSTPDSEILFFTQSRFNKIGSYFSYFSDSESGIHPGANRFDDEQDFRNEVDAASFQQFAAFRQGNRFWLGLEDQLGDIRPSFCFNPMDQPCSDYDFNDFIIAFSVPEGDEQTVPEPATLVMLAGGLFALAAVRRRRG